MRRFTDAIRQAVASRNWFGAVYIALAMPDICAKLENPKAAGSESRYRKWFDRYLASKYNADLPGGKHTFLSAGDCYALRCSILHEASEEIGQQRASDVLKRVYFTTLGSHLIHVNDTLTLNVGMFSDRKLRDDDIATWPRLPPAGRR